MTKRERDLENLKATYRYLETYIAAHGIPPTCREVGAAFGMTTEGAVFRLRRLKALGWIARDGRHQSIVLKGIK